MPSWLKGLVQEHLRPDSTLPTELVPFLTRGLIGHPSAWLPQARAEATFQWAVEPADGYVTGKLYVDGSQLDSEAKFCGCCSRRGWGFTAIDDGKVVAAAYGRPPGMIKTIPGTETWVLLQAMQVSVPNNAFRTDCDAVRLSCQKKPEGAHFCIPETGESVGANCSLP